MKRRIPMAALVLAVSIATWWLLTRPAAAPTAATSAVAVVSPPTAPSPARLADEARVEAWWAAPGPFALDAVVAPLFPEPAGLRATVDLPPFDARVGRLWWVERVIGADGEDRDQRLAANCWLKEDGFLRVDLSDLRCDGESLPACTIGFRDGALTMLAGELPPAHRRAATEAARDLLLVISGWRAGACSGASRLTFLSQPYAVVVLADGLVRLRPAEPDPERDEVIEGRQTDAVWTGATRRLQWSDDSGAGARRLEVIFRYE